MMYRRAPLRACLLLEVDAQEYIPVKCRNAASSSTNAVIVAVHRAKVSELQTLVAYGLCRLWLVDRKHTGRTFPRQTAQLAALFQFAHNCAQLMLGLCWQRYCMTHLE